MATPFTDYNLYQQALSNVNYPLSQRNALISETANFNAYLTSMHDSPAAIHASTGPGGFDQTMFAAFVQNNPAGAPSLASQTAMVTSANNSVNSLPAWLSGDYTFGTSNVPKVAVLGGVAGLLLLLLATKAQK